MKSASDIGHAGELFALFTIYMQGYHAQRSPNKRPYDLLLEVDSKIIKIQVKTSTHKDKNKKNGGYIYQLRRRTRTFVNQKAIHVDFKYKPEDFDIYAFVQPELLKVAFIHRSQITTKYKKILQPADYCLYPLKEALELV